MTPTRVSWQHLITSKPIAGRCERRPSRATSIGPWSSRMVVIDAGWRTAHEGCPGRLELS